MFENFNNFSAIWDGFLFMWLWLHLTILYFAFV